jgi:hypothetical protein
MPKVAYRRPPGPAPHVLIGNFPLASSDPLAIFTRWARQFGDMFYYRAGWVNVYFLNHPDLIESVLVTQPQNFRKDRVIQARNGCDSGGSRSPPSAANGSPPTPRP